EYMNAIGGRLGGNVGTLLGHSAVRLYAMGDECSDRPATDAELAALRSIVRAALDARAPRPSVTRHNGHLHISGQRIPPPGAAPPRAPPSRSSSRSPTCSARQGPASSSAAEAPTPS